MTARHSAKYIKSQSRQVSSPTSNAFIVGMLTAASIIPTAVATASTAYASDYNSAIHRTATGSNGASKKSANNGGIVSSVRKFAPMNVATASKRTDYLADGETVSRSYSRSAGTVTGDWGGIEELNIPVTKSTAQVDATASLKNAINAGQSTYDGNANKGAENERAALKSVLDE